MYDDYGAASGVDPGVGMMAGGMAGTTWLLVMVIWVVVVAGMWKMFVKAGKPGWASLIPYYNIYVLLKIAGKPGWWLILFFVPFANIVVAILMSLGVAKSFGKSALFGIVALILVPVVGYPMLGFGSAKYVGKADMAKATA